MNTQVIMRPETAADYPAIREVNDLAFGQKNESQLVEKLRSTAGFIRELSLAALVDGKVVGHILFYPITINNQNIKNDALALAPMSVRPDFQNKGVGGRLIREGLMRAKELGHSAVIVMGHADYYPRFGFVPAGRFGIKAPFDCPDEAFMAIELIRGALADSPGVVEYPEPFQDA